jgi:hypothetical protein
MSSEEIFWSLKKQTPLRDTIHISRRSLRAVEALTHVGQILDEFVLVGSVHDLIELDISLELSSDGWSNFKMLDDQYLL